MTDINIKTVLLGSSKAGKTSLVRRFVENTFNDSADFVSTIGGAFISREICFTPVCRVLLCIWDTAGEEKYESVTRTFYRNANAAVVCYDITDAKSWSRAKRWVSELRQFEEKCVIYLCGTKLDLLNGESTIRVVSGDVLAAYITSVNIRNHFETSSKTGTNVDALFRTIAADYLASNESTACKLENTSLESNEAKKTCCFLT